MSLNKLKFRKALRDKTFLMYEWMGRGMTSGTFCPLLVLVTVKLCLSKLKKLFRFIFKQYLMSYFTWLFLSLLRQKSEIYLVLSIPIVSDQYIFHQKKRSNISMNVNHILVYGVTDWPIKIMLNILRNLRNMEFQNVSEVSVKVNLTLSFPNFTSDIKWISN